MMYIGNYNTYFHDVAVKGDWKVEANRKVTVTQITTHYNSGMQKSISEHTVSNL